MDAPATALAEAPSRERRLKMLDRLAEAGLEIALAIERGVKDADPPRPLAELNAAAAAYAKASRAVRLAILLQEQLAHGGEDPDEAARRAEALRRKEHIGRAVRVVRRVARDHCRHGAFAVSAYAKEAAERLDDDDIYSLVATRPVGELVALICRDLGLQPNWDALAEEAWARAEIESGAEGSPFVEDDEAAEEDPQAHARPPPQSGGGGPRSGGGGATPPSFDLDLLQGKGKEHANIDHYP